MEELFRPAVQRGHVHVLHWAVSTSEIVPALHHGLRFCAMAAEEGHLSVLQYLRSTSPPFDWLDAYQRAILCNQPQILEWMLQNGHGMSESLFRHAITANNCPSIPAVLRRLYPPPPTEIPEYSLSASYEPIAFHLPAPLPLSVPYNYWNENTTLLAANQSELTLLKWLREECVPPCPWDERVLLQCTNVKNAQWMIENGCPCDITRCMRFCLWNGRKCPAWLMLLVLRMCMRVSTVDPSLFMEKDRIPCFPQAGRPNKDVS